jgi:VirE N-terminal domain
MGAHTNLVISVTTITTPATHHLNGASAATAFPLNAKPCDNESLNSPSAIVVSCVKNARDTATQDYEAKEIIESIRTDIPLTLRPLKLASTIEGIRKTFADTLDQTRDRKAAKNAVNEAKKQLPAVLFSGTFSQRRSGCLVQHSGFLCADLDELGEQLPDIWDKVKGSPHLWAMFRSPTGDGLKCVFRVQPDAAKHRQSFHAVEEHVRALAGIQIDEACSDVARLCFFSYDPDTYLNRPRLNCSRWTLKSLHPLQPPLYARRKLKHAVILLNRCSAK